MESNIANQDYFDGDLPLTEPHFDEEATLLSAQPVVPLREIRAERRSGKRLVFGLAMACSLMLGALGATFIYKQRGQKQTTAISTAVSGAAGIAADEPTTEDISGAATGTSQTDAPKPAAKSAVSTSEGAAPTVVETKQKKSLPQEADERELTRAERVEARRLRRRLERQARRDSGDRQRKSSAGLSRIRDIFEGPTRP